MNIQEDTKMKKKQTDIKKVTNIKMNAQRKATIKRTQTRKDQADEYTKLKKNTYKQEQKRY